MQMMPTLEDAFQRILSSSNAPTCSRWRQAICQPTQGGRFEEYNFIQLISKFQTIPAKIQFVIYPADSVKSNQSQET
jgi:hypothetical protein